MNFTLVLSLLSAVSGFILAWQLQAHQIIKQELTYANERISLQRASTNAQDAAKQAVIDAQNNAAKRVASLRRDADGARAELDRLRSATASAVPDTPSSPDASFDRAATLAKLLNECGAAYQDLGERADRHVSDLKTLMDAWPK